MEKLLTGAKKEKETATKVREVFQAIKILNFDKYINPDNETERRVTAIRWPMPDIWTIPLFLKSIMAGENR